MGKFTHAKNNFISGELSPKLDGRSDIQEYFNGAAQLENFIPGREGGANRRPGSLFIRDITSDDAPLGSLYPFVVDRTTSYLVSLDTTNGEILIYEVDTTGANPVANIIANIMASGIESSIIGNDPYGFSYAQVNDIMFVTHISGSVEPFVIQRTSPTQFRTDTYRGWVYGPLSAIWTVDPYVKALAFTPLNTDVNHTMQYSTSTNILSSNSSVFTPVMVGSYVRVDTGAGAEIVLKIQSFINSLSVNVTVPVPPDINVGATYKWAINSWNNEYGWPKTVSLFQQRLCWGGTAHEPSTVWCSGINNLKLLLNYKLEQDATSDPPADVSGLDYFGPITDADAFEVVVSSDISSKIYWMSSDRSLQVGTVTAEYVITTSEGKFGPFNANVTAQTFFGSSPSRAIRVQNSTVFIENTGKGIRELGFSEENGSNVSRLLSILSEEIVYHNVDTVNESVFNTSYKQIIYQPSRSCIWAITTSNEVVGLVIEKSSNTLAWHKHTIAGSDVKVLGLAVIPDQTGKFDNIYINVERTINSVTVRYLEEIGQDFNVDTMFGHYNGDNKNHPIYTDSCIYPTVKTHGVTKADVPHLEGETVEVLYRGEYLGTKIVLDDLGGPPYVEIGEDFVAGEVVLGLGYTSRIKSMVIEAGSKTGDAAIQQKRLDRALVKLYKSMRYKIGSTDTNLEGRNKVQVSDKTLLYTGDDELCIESSPKTDQRFIIESDGPFPLNILSVTLRGETQD